jgi:hypothetical protein
MFQRRASFSLKLISNSCIKTQQRNKAQCFQKLILAARNLAKMSPICHCSIPGYVREACQSIHWIHRVEMKQSISCGLACGVIISNAKNIPRISVYYFSIVGYIVSYSQKGVIRYTKPVSKYFYDKIALLISCANGCTFATTKHTYQCSHAVKEHPDVGAVFRCTHVQLSAMRMY